MASKKKERKDDDKAKARAKKPSSSGYCYLVRSRTLPLIHLLSLLQASARSGCAAQRKYLLLSRVGHRMVASAGTGFGGFGGFGAPGFAFG